MDHLTLNRIKGALYGQAIGDALGLATEFMSADESQSTYPGGVRRYEDLIKNDHNDRWEKGDWTDDTDQMLCIVDAIINNNGLTVPGVANEFHRWFNDTPMGIGNTVYAVLSDPDFTAKPTEIAKKVWIESGRNGAANGGVMRTSILGIYQFNSIDKVIRNCIDVCRITHYDPRCVASCVAVGICVSALISGNDNIEDILRRCGEKAAVYDKGVTAYLNTSASIEDLKLDEYESIGYTYKALSAGFWALKYAPNFASGLNEIILQGGDADTNACVAGAILGARFGFSKVPNHLIDGLNNRRLLEMKIESLLKLM